MSDEISLSTLLKDVSPEDLDSFLAKVTKYEKLFDKGILMVEKLEKLGVIPAIIRTAGAKAGIKDLDKPLQNPLAFVAKTPAHFEFYRMLNDMSEEDVSEMNRRLLTALKAMEAKKEEENEEKNKGSDSNTNTG